MPRSKKNRQAGGRVLMPIQYYDPNAKVPAYYPKGDSHLNNGNTAYGVYRPVSFGEPTGSGFKGYTGPNLAPYPNSTKTQTGGAIYNTITNPESGRKVSIFTKKGRQILENYVQASK